MRESPPNVYEGEQNIIKNHGYQNEKMTKILGCIRRRAPLYEQPDRTIYLNKADLEIPDNHIETSKYNWLTFLPENLLLQFSRIANLYFLIIGVCQMIPIITTTDGKPLVYTPLSIIILISMSKDFWEDYQRHKADSKENNKTVHLLSEGSTFQDTRSETLRVGHIIKIKEKEYFPADVLLLQSSHKSNGVIYIETKNLDGETNLKPIQVPRICMHFFSHDEDFNSEAVSPDHLQFCYEKPNPHMYSFSGYLMNVQQSHQKYFVEASNFVKRGCSLQNTAWCIGLVLYTGHDTKIMLNQVRGKYKKSQIEKKMNRQIMFVFLLVMVLCFFCSTFYVIFYKMTEDIMPYLYITQEDLEANSVENFFFHLPMWFLLLATFVPISLLVTLELVKFFQGIMINKDENLKCKQSGEYARANSSNLNEELGLINYVITDKTGTLTANLMQFRCISVGQDQFGFQQIIQESIQKEGLYSAPQLSSQSQQELKVVDFKDEEFIKQLNTYEHANYNKIMDCLNCINLCHTITVENEEQQSQVIYNAFSPDEFALINFTQSIGYQFIGQDSQGYLMIRNDIKPNSNNNQPIIKFKLLHSLAFSYERKRMSVIVKNEHDHTILFSKGADSVLLSLANKDQNINTDQFITKLQKDLQLYSEQGLRTLVLGKKILSQQQYDTWNARYQIALASLDQDRQKNIEILQSEIEYDLQLIGATAIEDKLQDNVHGTIRALREASIKVWMLTGDKIETAINIGYSCNILSSACKVFQFSEQLDSSKAVSQELLSVENYLNEQKLIQEQKRQLLQNNQSSVMSIVTDPQLQEQQQKQQFDISQSSPSSPNKPINNTINCTNKESSSPDKQLGPDYQQQACIVISGQTFQHIYQNKDLMERFMKCAIKCHALIAARVTPKEKQLFVYNIKSFDPNSVTLAIGDGANDVAMINESHLGVGIKGVEGREAAKASDYELGEFKLLQRLLFYTGRECCRRNSYLILFNFYKNQTLYLAIFWYGVYSGFSAVFIYDQWINQLFNLIFTSLPIILYALFDEQYASGDTLSSQLHNPNVLEQRPDLYRQISQNPIFTFKAFWIWLISGSIQSVILLFLGFNIFSTNFNNDQGYTNDLVQSGMLVFSAAVILNNFKIFLITYTHYVFTIIFIIGSIISYFFILWLASIPSILDSYGYYSRIFGSANAPLALIVMTACTCGIDMVVQRYQMFQSNMDETEQYEQQIDSDRSQNIEMPSLNSPQQLNNSTKKDDLNISTNLNSKLNK